MGSIKLTLVGLCFSMGVVLKVKSKYPYRSLLEELNYIGQYPVVGHPHGVFPIHQ